MSFQSNTFTVASTLVSASLLVPRTAIAQQQTLNCMVAMGNDRSGRDVLTETFDMSKATTDDKGITRMTTLNGTDNGAFTFHLSLCRLPSFTYLNHNSGVDQCTPGYVYMYNGNTLSCEGSFNKVQNKYIDQRGPFTYNLSTMAAEATYKFQDLKLAVTHTVEVSVQCGPYYELQTVDEKVPVSYHTVSGNFAMTYYLKLKSRAVCSGWRFAITPTVILISIGALVGCLCCCGIVAFLANSMGRKDGKADAVEYQREALAEEDSDAGGDFDDYNY